MEETLDLYVQCKIPFYSTLDRLRMHHKTKVYFFRITSQRRIFIQWSINRKLID